MSLNPDLISAICNDRYFKYVNFSNLVLENPATDGQVIGYQNGTKWVDLGDFSTQINSMQAQLNDESSDYIAIANATTQLNGIQNDVTGLTQDLTSMDELFERLVALSWASLVTPTPITLDLTGLGIPEPTPANPNYPTYLQFLNDGWIFIGLEFIDA